MPALPSVTAAIGVVVGVGLCVAAILALQVPPDAVVVRRNHRAGVLLGSFLVWSVGFLFFEGDFGHLGFGALSLVVFGFPYSLMFLSQPPGTRKKFD